MTSVKCKDLQKHAVRVQGGVCVECYQPSSIITLPSSALLLMCGVRVWQSTVRAVE